MLSFPISIPWYRAELQRLRDLLAERDQELSRLKVQMLVESKAAALNLPPGTLSAAMGTSSSALPLNIGLFKLCRGLAHEGVRLQGGARYDGLRAF